jgi:hypothetical protein
MLLKLFKPIQAYSSLFKPIQGYSRQKIKKIILGMFQQRDHRGRNAPRLCAFA